MPTSGDWKAYFESHSRELMTIPWDVGGDLVAAEASTIRRSVQEFQRGESSEGHHLIENARRYAERTGDADYVAAIRLFIAEEQRHARDLARVLTLNNIPLIKGTFTDRVFRSLRHLFASLEVSVGVLITAEIIAKVYYLGLRGATRSAVLGRLCDQILVDEVKHVEFQAEQLQRMRARRGKIAMTFTLAAQRFLFLGTVLVVWVFHRATLVRGGMTLRTWWNTCWQEFVAAFHGAGE
jgi:hypothetical protein